jgi:hypothetical protein
MSTATEEFEFDSLVCPECEDKSPTSEWPDCDVYCEDCGEHVAVMCPRCEERFDCVWGYDKVRKATEEAE